MQKHPEQSRSSRAGVWLGNQAIPGNDTPPIIKLSAVSVQIFPRGLEISEECN